MDFLLCKPDHYGINYSINLWMDTNNSADIIKAKQQWDCLDKKIKELGANVVYVDPVKDLPDMVFTANAALILNNKDVYVSKFKHSERSHEEKYFRSWFENNGYNILDTKEFFEGAGDALYFGPNLIGGHGFRSEKSFYEPITKTTVRLINPYFYHLDTCFCPLQKMDYMIFPGAFDEDSLNKIRSFGGNEITVPEIEAKLFACNAVRIENNVILPAGCSQTEKMLNENGYITHALEMSEFIKSGGACKCLTLVLND